LKDYKDIANERLKMFFFIINDDEI